jgi:predicted MPP superfamily phosphohydrolase
MFLPALVAGTVAAGAAWALFEAQWIELNEVDVLLPGLSPELDGFRILHLSDFHLGTLSLSGQALERAVAWAEGQQLDLVVLTGDLLSRQRGEPKLRDVLRRLSARHGIYAILGNHDIDVTRDPFSRPTDASAVEEEGAVLLEDQAAAFDVKGSRVQIVGCHPRAWWRRQPERLADRQADLRILLSHFPDIVDRLAPDVFHLVLAGHLHGGQICLPSPRGKLRLEHLRARYWEGLHRTPAATLYVSRGIGTSFVPFRFLARPEATTLTLRAA